MHPRFFRACLAAAVGILGLSTGHACMDLEPRQAVEFAPGSAVIPGDQMSALMQMLQHARELPGPRRVIVRGYADRSTNFDAKAWAPEDLALADARARALSRAVRTLGSATCVERVALGNIPEDAPGQRTDARGGLRLARGMVVFENPDTEHAPREGVRIERDCGAPGPAAAD